MQNSYMTSLMNTLKPSSQSNRTVALRQRVHKICILNYHDKLCNFKKQTIKITFEIHDTRLHEDTLRFEVLNVLKYISMVSCEKQLVNTGKGDPQLLITQW